MRCRWLVDFATKTLHSVRGSDKDPFSGVDIDVNGLGWGLAVVTSRAFRTRGPDKPAALLPLIDMCNHSFEPNCQIVGDRSDVTLVAKKDIEVGILLLACIPGKPDLRYPSFFSHQLRIYFAYP